ncbi:MAG: SAM-dependent methyltransferase [Ornithinimicrobium sp.]
MESGFVPWDTAWHQALYGPEGFYRRPEGPTGHFSTSVGGVPHAPSVMASAVVALARRHDLGTVVDVGAARGDFITAVHRLGPDLRCVGVDIVDRPRDLSQEIEWVISPGGAELPPQISALEGTLVFAHEWLDVVPTAVAQRDASGRWHQQHVDPATGRTHLGEALAGAQEQWLQRWARRARVTEVGLNRDHALADLVDRVDDGLVVAVDYGHQTHDLPPEGTLTGYRAGHAVLPVPDGSMDLTAHVHLDALLEHLRRRGVRVVGTRQADLLDELLGVALMPAHASARSQPAAYLTALAEHSAHRVLREPGGFGAFWWVLAERTR